MKKKVLLTGVNGMLAYDFLKYLSNIFEIIWFDRKSLNITNQENIEKIISEIKPDIILNCAAYTQVDNAEDEWKLLNFEINTIWTYNLAKISSKYNIDFITISTDYVFDGKKENWYNEDDKCNPINEYWMSKYLWECLALQENKNTIIIRTSWLYWWWKEFKNFVNTMLKLSESKNELKIINDQFWIPTYTKDLSFAIWEVIEKINIFRWKILHFSNYSEKDVTWFDFASEIFKIANVKTSVIPCSTQEYITKAKRPVFSKLINNSNIKLKDWKDGLKDYLNNL